MKSLWPVSLAIAIGFTAASAGADPPAGETSDSRTRSSGFFAMDREDHRDWTLEIAGGAMYLDAEGKIGFESNSHDYVFGVNALDLEREWTGWAGIDLKFARKHHLRFGFLPVEFDGERSIEIALPPEDPIFAIGDRVESRAKLHTYQLSYLYDFYLGKYVTLSPSLTLGLIDAKVRLADDTLGLDFDEDQLVPLPELGLRLEIYPCARLSIFGEGKGFTIGSKATEWDAGGGIKLFVNRHFFVQGSYRVIDYDVDWFDVVIDTRFHGPFVGGGLRF